MLGVVGACAADARCRQLIGSFATNTPIPLSLPLTYNVIIAADSNLGQVIGYDGVS
jgi:hypothetical protein